MNKVELAGKLAIQIGLTQKKSLQILNTLFSSLTSALQDGEEIRIVGFGTFRTRRRKSRIGYLPVTKKEVQIPEGRVVSFVASNTLKRHLIG